MTSLELTIESPHDSSSRRIIADHTPFSLGRALDNDLPLPFESVSGRHLTIDQIGEETIRVTDLKSTNGTRIDDRRLPPGQTVGLELPVRLRLGDVEVTIRLLGQHQETAFTMAQSSTRLREMVDEAVRQSHSGEDDQPFVELLDGPDQGRRHLLQPGGPDLTVGSGDSVDVDLPLAESSGPAATLSWREDGCWLVPEAQTVKLQDRRLTRERRLRSGDRFRVESTELLYFDPLGEELESLQAGVHQRKSRQTGDTDEDTVPDASSSPRDPSGEAPDRDDDGSARTKKPAPQLHSEHCVAGLGVVELTLLAMSLFFLAGTLALVAIFLTA